MTTTTKNKYNKKMKEGGGGRGMSSWLLSSLWRERGGGDSNVCGREGNNEGNTHRKET